MDGSARSRLWMGALAAQATVLVGTLGYYYLGGGQWTLFDCLYMAVITLSTVGFGEVLTNFDKVPYVRLFTLILMLFGVGAILYFVSTLTAFVVEGDIGAQFRKKRMLKKIRKLEDHYIVCGAGSTGRHVIEELIRTHRVVIGIDTDSDRLESIAEDHPKAHYHYLQGDATDDHVLAEAHVDSAAGVVAALASDKDNLYITISSRQANPDVRIVARGSDLGVLSKLKQAGADTVISPNYIGGMRMVSEMVRPEVVRFLDAMLRNTENVVRLEEIAIKEGSSLAGCRLRDSKMREQRDVAVLAVRMEETDEYLYSPGGDFRMAAGMNLLLLGPTQSIDQLRRGK